MLKDLLKNSKIIRKGSLFSSFILIFFALTILYLAYGFTFERSDDTVKEDIQVVEYETSYRMPSELPNQKLLKCSEQVKNNIVFYEKSDNHVVYVVDKSSDRDVLYLEDSEILIFSETCDLISKLEGYDEKLGVADSMNYIELRADLLIINYHLNPNVSVIRHFEIESREEEYFAVHYPPESIQYEY